MLKRALNWLSLPPPRALGTLAALLLSVLGVFVYAHYVDPIYPIKDWLVWPLSAIWGYTALANLAWLSVGSLVVCRLLGLRELPLLETLVVSTLVGVVAFTEIMYLAGALGLYGPIFALLLAAGLSLAGAPELLRLWRRHRENSASQAPAGPWLLLLWGIGAALTGVIYLGILTPDAVNYDATWCHLTIAQDYAREGRIVAFPGDYSKNVPQLASLLHTWSFLVPGLTPPLRWMLALHQEFGLFLWTLAGVAATVRFMVGAPGPRGAWVAFYLFPIIFVYDHNLGGAADHVAAAFTLPGLLATCRLLEHLSWKRALLMALCMAGGFLTKYQAIYWIVPCLLVVAVRWSVVAYRSLRGGEGASSGRRRLWLLPLVAGAAFCLLVAPHFLKNWWFYRNPLYPFMQDVFTASRPTVENGSFLFGHIFTDLNWVPKGGVFEKLRHALELSVTFSFKPHYSFTKDFPVFGSLFTLLLPALLFVPQRRWKALGAFVGMVTLLIWGVTFNVDRNLQVFMPILVATTAAILVGIFQLGRLAGLAILPLVLFQIAWGGDAVWYSSHERISGSLELIRSGYQGTAKRRFERYRPAFRALHAALPVGSKVVLHTAHVSLGIDRELVLDWAGFQGLISYAQIKSARELYDHYKKLGITHVLYYPGERPAASQQEDVVFNALVGHLGPPVSTSGGFRLLKLPPTPPPKEQGYTVAVVGAYGYGYGLFAVEKLSTIEYLAPNLRKHARPDAPLPAERADLELAGIDAMIVGPGGQLSPGQSEFLHKRFTAAVQYSGQHAIYLPKQRSSR